MDSPTTHPQLADIGSIFADGSPLMWAGPPDAPKTITISYTATDTNGDGASATARYILTEHDEYENWHRVSSQGGPIDPQAAGAPGSLDLLGTATTMPGAQPSITVQDGSVQYTVDGLVGGGIVASAGTAWILLPEAFSPPGWVGIVLSLSGLALQTAASLPSDTTSVVPPTSDQFTASFLQQAYENYLYGVPGEQSNTNLVDANFAQYLAKNQNFDAYINGGFSGVTITSTVYQQMWNYYFQADKYDNGGKLPQPATGSVSKPSGYVWSFLWHYTGAPPPPSNPNP